LPHLGPKEGAGKLNGQDVLNLRKIIPHGKAGSGLILRSGRRGKIGGKKESGVFSGNHE